MLRKIKRKIRSLLKRIKRDSGKGKKPFEEKYKKQIEKLSKITGMRTREATAVLKKASSELHVKPATYMNFCFWGIPESEQREWAEQVKTLEKQRAARANAKKNRNYEIIAEMAGCSLEEAKAMAAKAAKKYKITLSEFVNNKYYNATDEEMQEGHAKYVAEYNEKTNESKEDRYNRLADILGCSPEEAKEKLTEAAYRLNISAPLYMKHKLYEVPEEEQPAAVKKIILEEEESRQRREANYVQRLNRIAVREGVTPAVAEKNMRDAWFNYGITHADYLRYGFYNVPDEEKEAKYQTILDKRAADLEIERQECITAVMESTGVSREDAEEIVRKANEVNGISYRAFRRYHLFELPEAEQIARYKEILAQLRERTQVQIRDNDKFLEKISNQTGWSREEIIEKLEEADRFCGASWKDYYAYKFWEKEDYEQKEYFTTGMQIALSERFDELSNRDIFVNKENFLDKFDKNLGRAWARTAKLTEEEFREKFGGCKSVLYKPLNNGNAGEGIEVFSMDEPEAAFSRIKELSDGLLEEYLIQHDELSRLYPNSVNTVRVASVCWEDEATGQDQFRIAYATLRMGSGGSNVDNFTTGGMVASVDLATGTAITDGVNIEGEKFVQHPDTGTVIKGFKVPFFKEGLEMIKKAGEGIHGYIGWDLAITNNGPVLIEANIDPGNRLLQMAWVPEDQGKAYVMYDFLKMTDFYDEHPEADLQGEDFFKDHVYVENKKYIDEIVKNQKNETEESAYEKMVEAVTKYGISKDEYVNERYYYLKEESLDKLLTDPSISGKVDYVADKYKAPRGTVYARAMNAYNAYKIPLYAFVSEDAYDITSKEEFLKIKQKLEEGRKARVDELVEITGWDAPAVHKYIADIYNKYQVDAVFIKDHELFKLSDEEAAEVVAKEKADIQKRRERIKEANNWTDFDLERSLSYCKYRYSVYELKTYDNIQCWKYPREVLDTFAVPRDCLEMTAEYNTRPTDVLDDKTLFDETYRQFLGRKFWINRDTSIEEFKEFIDGLTAVFCKPINLLGGHGSYRYELKGTVEEMYDYFMNEVKMVIEEIPVQHPVMNEIYSNCMNSVRITTVLKDGKFIPFNCWVKFGGKGSVVDGRVGGGCFAGVDPETGVVDTLAIDIDNNRFAVHQDTGKQITGLKIPYWEEAKALTEKALRHVDGIDFVGWDLFITEKGPIIVEGNSKPAFADIQLLYNYGDLEHPGQRWRYEHVLTDPDKGRK